MTICIKKGIFYTGQRTTVFQTLNMTADSQHGLPALSFYHCGTNKSTPITDMRIGRKRKPHWAVKTAARIPAAAFFHIVQSYLYHITLTRLQIWCGIYLESIVAIHPTSSLLSIDADNRLCHRSVKIQHGMSITLWY